MVCTTRPPPGGTQLAMQVLRESHHAQGQENRQATSTFQVSAWVWQALLYLYVLGPSLVRIKWGCQPSQGKSQCWGHSTADAPESHLPAPLHTRDTREQPQNLIWGLAELNWGNPQANQDEWAKPVFCRLEPGAAWPLFTHSTLPSPPPSLPHQRLRKCPSWGACIIPLRCPAHRGRLRSGPSRSLSIQAGCTRPPRPTSRTVGPACACVKAPGASGDTPHSPNLLVVT